MIDWNKRNGGFLSPESVYEDQLGNLSMQINQKDKEIERLNNIINELEKELKECYEEYKDVENIELRTTALEDLAILNRIRELKEGK